jgi:hypothetical protein
MMQTMEGKTLTEMTVMPRDESRSVPKVGNYEPVRFNAMKHGILSRLAVLGHEDQTDFDDLLAGLIDEYQPVSVTERHLIEELATIIWRKRRVLLAEGAKINEGLKNALNNAAAVIKSAVPFRHDIGGGNADLREFMECTPEEIAKRQRDAALDLAATRRAASILRKGGPNAYARARQALLPESCDWWDEHIHEKKYPATAQGLAEFIRNSLEPICHRMMKEAEFSPAIRAQTLGEGLRAHLLEKLNRYEIHLDRKFERTLAMLLKLRDLRSQ